LKKLNHILLWDDYYIEGYALLIMILGCFHPLFFIILLIYVYWQRRSIKIPVILIGAVLLLTRFYFFEIKEIPNFIHGNAKIVEIASYENSDMIVIRYQNIRYQAFVEPNLYQIGDCVLIEANVNQYRNQTIPYGFNQNSYYLSHNVRGYLKISNLSFVSHSFSIYSLRQQLDNYITQFQSQVYIKALILGEKSFTEQQTSTYRSLGILYLFTVSGLHIYGLLIGIKKIFFYLSLTEKKQFWLTVLVYLVILYFNAFSMSVLRIVLIFLIQNLAKKMKIDLSRVDYIHLAFFLLLLFRIEWVYHLGFLMLFVILNFIYLMSHVYSNLKGYIKRAVLSILIILSILPFQSTISPFLIILLPALMIFITGPIYFLSLFILIIPELDQVLSFFIEYFELLIHMIELRNFSIALPSLPMLGIVLYYVLLIFLFKSRSYLNVFKRSILIVILFSFFIIDIKLTNDTKFYMIDVGQGDSMLIESPTCNLVIDSFQNVLPLINSLGIYHLDLLILTHSDNDHIKEAQTIINHIDVEKVIINPYNAYPIYHEKMIEMKTDDHLSCGDLDISFLGPIRKYDDANNNSLVFKITIGVKTFLFTGDIEKEAESDLVFKYGHLLKSDVLKVPHHGSSSSSSNEFINMVLPDVALISLSESNRFGFPNQDVINRLIVKQVDIYRTDQMGTICYTYHQKKEKWSLYLPF